jgi:hypothetical protein
MKVDIATVVVVVAKEVGRHIAVSFVKPSPTCGGQIELEHLCCASVDAAG